MKVNGLNVCYEVEIKEMNDGREGIAITLRNLFTGMMSVVVSKENWEKLRLNAPQEKKDSHEGSDKDYLETQKAMEEVNKQEYKSKCQGNHPVGICILCFNGFCNSDYNKGKCCDGIDIREDCPYKNERNFAMDKIYDRIKIRERTIPRARGGMEEDIKKGYYKKETKNPDEKTLGEKIFIENTGKLLDNLKRIWSYKF